MTRSSDEEYTNIMYVYNLCDYNTWAAVEEYRWRFPYRRVPDGRVFSNVYQSMRQTGAVSQRKYERPQQQCTAQVEDDILEMVWCSSTNSIWRIANRFGTPQTAIWGTIHDLSLYLFHIQTIQAVQTGDRFAQKEFCYWLLHSRCFAWKFYLVNIWTACNKRLSNLTAYIMCSHGKLSENVFLWLI